MDSSNLQPTAAKPKKKPHSVEDMLDKPLDLVDEHPEQPQQSRRASGTALHGSVSLQPPLQHRVSSASNGGLNTDTATRVYAEGILERALSATNIAPANERRRKSLTSTLHQLLGGSFKSNNSIDRTTSIITHQPFNADLESTAVITPTFRVASSTTFTVISSGAGTGDHAVSGGNSTAIQNLHPLPHPEFMSQLARVFMDHVPTGTYTRDNIDYKSCFRGSLAVDVLCKLMNCLDRRVAVEVGKTMQQQKLFIEVTYRKQFRDDPSELFQFTSDRITSSNLPVITVGNSQSLQNISITIPSPKSDGGSDHNVSIVEERIEQQSAAVAVHESMEMFPGVPTGIITSLTKCYASHCPGDQTCYSFSCPTRVVMTTKAMAKAARSRKMSISHDAKNTTTAKLWSTFASPEVVESVSVAERQRQEIVFEIINTETEFVEDLKILHTAYQEPLSRSDIIPKARRDEFVSVVFGNLEKIISINEKLLERLLEKRKDEQVVSSLADAFEQWSASIDPYIEYGRNQVLSKHQLDNELKTNFVFQKFCEANERRPECRRLPIQSFLARPTTRMGRYPILLEAYLTRTPMDHTDQPLCKEIIERLKKTLQNINSETGKADNALRLKIIHDRLVYQDEETNATVKENLDLLNPTRQLIRDGVLKKRTGVDMVDLDVFLFDHYLLLAKSRTNMNGQIEYRIHRRPIPLHSLILQKEGDSHIPAAETPTSNSSRTASRQSSFQDSPAVAGNSRGLPIHIFHMGKRGHMYVLYASSIADRKQWIDKITAAVFEVQRQMKKFEVTSVLGDLTSVTAMDLPSFMFSTRVLCTAKYKTDFYLGTDHGLFGGPADDLSSMRLILDTPEVSQVEFIQPWKLCLVVADKKLMVYPIGIIKESCSANVVRLGRKISSKVSFFRIGVNYDSTYLAVVKTKLLYTAIKVFEFIESNDPARKKGRLVGFIDRLKSNTSLEDFRLYKEIHLPSQTLSLTFLKTKICIGCDRGFELIDISTLQSQSLLDVSDESLAFVVDKENLAPLGLYKLDDTEFMLCYQEFGICVDKMGRNTRPNSDKGPAMTWLCSPHGCYYRPPFIFLFATNMIEIRNVITGNLVQVIPVSRGHFLECPDGIYVSDTIQISTKSPASGLSRSGTRFSLVKGGESSRSNMSRDESDSMVTTDGALSSPVGSDTETASRIFTLTEINPLDEESNPGTLSRSPIATSVSFDDVFKERPKQELVQVLQDDEEPISPPSQ